ncbi:ATP-dependent helicase [Alicyclobacillus dauci]|uniref:UvrD-helicase domain-containing protein n=1 Tax=Alicyclobacillus dauci TaxID=1475485 RepID=A0ABY6Z0V7_9BACL|nr:UvrD-helicase domain-containing protein [Alicyclobacillus dauci]WAH35969.1 UvrD-helicase domain-containing protein [Alicyclobacillus dauci]
MPKLEDLNEAQREAAMHVDGPCVVVAGAGSGKTSMLVTRVAELIKAGVPPNRILCCTFTRKATKEMGERIVRDIGPRAKPVVVSTIHGLALRMVMPKMEGWKLVSKTEWMFEVVLGPKSTVNRYGTGFSKELNVEDAMLAIGKAKNSKQRPEQVEDPIVRQVYRAYEDLKKARKMLDFDDLLLKANEFLRTDANFAQKMQSRFTHISVDEFQDVNLVQWDLIRKLAEPHHNLLVVGDDFQSIYGFRGARPELIIC